jgi:molybdopterin-guanine dinucleotide biosynthesis protein MobB
MFAMSKAAADAREEEVTMAVDTPSPAVSIVGRHNSGKTTLIVQLIAELTARGYDVGSAKHHSHVGFQIDVPGKDSYRHRAAGATETVIAAPGQIAMVRDCPSNIECSDIVKHMPGHDIVIVEGYRLSGLPTIEIMRADNPADVTVARVFDQASRSDTPLGTDFVQEARRTGAPKKDGSIRELQPREVDDIAHKMPTGTTIAVVTDIPLARDAAQRYHIPAFDLNDIDAIVDFLRHRFCAPRITVAIQAGGESRRMGRSKATVPFAGKPLINRLIERLSGIADEMIVTTNEPGELGFIAQQFPDSSIRLVRDLLDYRGALPGFYTAMKSARTEYVAITACDMIYASPNLYGEEIKQMMHSDADIVVPRTTYGYEPFHALYRRSTCLPAIEAALKRGDTRANSFYKGLKVRCLDQEDILRVEPMGKCFINVNTPDELKDREYSLVSSEPSGDGERANN